MIVGNKKEQNEYNIEDVMVIDDYDHGNSDQVERFDYTHDHDDNDLPQSMNLRKKRVQIYMIYIM